MRFTFLVLIMSFIWGCNPQDSSVEIKTSGIFKPILFGIDDQDLSGKDLDLGEWVTSDGPKGMTVTVRNNTLFPYTEIDLAFSPLNNEFTAMRFKPLETGESAFPGLGGTCERTLPAGTSCTIMVELLPPIDGEYKEQLHLSFKNYVDFENHIGSIYILSGIPAELAIQEIPSRIRFGDLVGSEALVERTIVKTYTQNFTIKNVGGLSARNIIIKNINICKDVNDNLCDEYGDAYTITSPDCYDGKNIKKNETCDFTLTYTPKNNPEIIAERYERIRYEGGLTVEYIKNPTGSRATLGINYDSLSSKIEGRLLPISAVDLTNNGIGIVQGNRLFKIFRTTNVGYRSLRINKIRVTKPKLTDSTDEAWALCERQAGSTILNCYDETDATKAPLPLKKFPFSISDVDSCVGDKNNGPLLPINNGCNFKVTFQPSSETFFIDPLAAATNFEQTDYSKLGKDMKFFVIYDSQWKDGENHCDNQVDCDPLPETGYRKTNYSIIVRAKRKSAARLELLSIKYNNIPLFAVSNAGTEINNSPDSSLNYLRTFDFGRLALLASSQKGKASSFKKITMIFKNVGQDSAFLEKISYPLDDQNELTIPYDSQIAPVLNDSNNCIDTLNHCYYRNARVTSDCTEVSTEQLCTLEILFAPFVFTNLSFDKNRAMYDYPFPPGLTAEKFKTFKVFYKNGSSFTDNPIITTPDFSVLKSEVKLRATLTEKGQLEEIADDPENFKALNMGLIKGSKTDYKMRITNVGSGQVAKINLALGGTGYDFTTAPDCNLPVKDCRCYQSSITNCQYAPTDDSLASDQECFLPLSWKLPSTLTAAETTELSRIQAGQIGPVEKTNDTNRVNYDTYQSTISFSLTSNLSYYDCFRHTAQEIAAGKAGPTYLPDFGYPITQPQFTTSVSPIYMPVRLVPMIPSSSPPGMRNNWHTTMIGRMPMTYTNNYVERIFYEANSASSINLDFLNPFIDSQQNTSFIQAARDSYKLPKVIYSSTAIQNILTANETNTIKYYFFMGSFPLYAVGSTTTSYKIPFSLVNVNLGTGTGAIRSIDISSVAGANSINLRQINNNVEAATPLASNLYYDYPITTSGSAVYSTEINPSLCTTGKCLYAINVLFTYDTAKRNHVRDGTNWIKSCPPATDSECERKVRVVIFAEVDSTTTSPVRFDSAQIGVNLLANNSFYETCTNPLTQFTTGTWNQVAGGTSLGLSSLKANIPVPSTAVYDKRVIKITNVSASNINIKRIMLRTSDTTNPVSYVAPGAGDIRLNIQALSSAKDATCASYDQKLCGTNTILTPNNFCYTTIRYIPTVANGMQLYLGHIITSDTTGNYQHPHNIYNVPLSFQPILPATLALVLPSNQQLSKVNALTRLTNQNTIGATQSTINSVFKVSLSSQLFNQSSPTEVVNIYQKVLNTNTTNTKASLLYQWRLYNNNLVGEPQASDFIPDPNDSRSYILIGENTKQFMKIFASRQCLYGSDAVPNTSSGFLSSEQNCYLRISISKKHDNMFNESNISRADTIDPYIYRINFYSAGRSVLSNFVFYVEFNIKPAPLLASNLNTSWGAITSVGLTTNLSFPAHTAATPNIGTIVGYRVIRTKLTTSLSDFFNIANADITRQDVFNTTSPVSTFTAPTSETGRIYHYKVLAIRQHPNFTRGDVLFGFASNKKDHFITDITNFNFVKVFVPPAGNMYIHSQKMLVDSTRFSTAEAYSTALTRCTAKTVTIKNGNTTASLQKTLMNSVAWDQLATADKNDPQWISSVNPITFLSMCPNMQSFEYTDPSNRCFRTSLDLTTGRELRGNLFEFSLISPAYIEANLFYGYSRCMTNLSTYL